MTRQEKLLAKLAGVLMAVAVFFFWLARKVG